MKKILSFCFAFLLIFGQLVFAEEVEDSASIEVEKITLGEVRTKNKEADEIFNEFYNTVKFIETDTSQHWTTFLKGYSIGLEEEAMYDSGPAQDFEDFVKDGTKEKYLAMSALDQFLYYDTYLRFVHILNLGERDYYFGDIKKFHNHTINDATSRMTWVGCDETGEIVKEAYLKLANWQYDYIQEYRSPYDFVTGLNYFETKKLKYEEETDEKKEISNDKETQEVEKLQENAKSTWYDFFKLLQRGIPEFGLLLVLSIAVAVITFIRKCNNIDDNKK